MAERHAAYIVVLADDIREDSAAAEATLTCLRMIKGVAAVRPVEASYEQVIARERVDRRWRDALHNLARTGPGDE